MQIRRLVRVTDTRSYEEIGDRWLPIPGSGIESECARCGRLHEIHAEVELEDGSSAVVGVSCARGESIEPEVKRGASQAKSRARVIAELSAARASHDRVSAIYAEVDSLTPPAVRWSEVEITVGRSAGTLRRVAIVGDARACRYNQWQTDAEVAANAIDRWRVDQRALRGAGTEPPYAISQKITALERRLERIESKSSPN